MVQGQALVLERISAATPQDDDAIYVEGERYIPAGENGFTILAARSAISTGDYWRLLADGAIGR